MAGWMVGSRSTSSITLGSNIGPPIGDPIELQPGEDPRELAWSILKSHHRAKPNEDPYRNKPLPWNPAVVPW